MLRCLPKDTNIKWKHGINALPPDEQSGMGRISIILWGLVGNVVEEDDSPPILDNSKRFGGRDPRGGGGRGGGGGGGRGGGGRR